MGAKDVSIDPGIEHHPDYMLPRDYLENDRINLQHYLWLELFGYHIHPLIPRNQPNIRIADVGTGTAIWLTDLARRLPESVQLDRLDVSFDACPPTEWLPKNVNLLHFDVFKDVPDELVGVYDIVHIRLFAFVLRDDQIAGVLKRLQLLLKPGGWLQWGEPDMLSWRVEKTNADNETDALDELREVSTPQDARLRPKWVTALPEFLKNAEFCDVQVDVKDGPDDLKVANHDCSLILPEMLARNLKNVAVQEKLKSLMPRVARETRAGSIWAFTRHTVIGRKDQ